MMPEQLLARLRQAPVLRDKTFLNTAFAVRQRFPMDKLTPEEAFVAHVRIWTIFSDALTEQQQIALFEPMENTPLYKLDDALDKYAEHYKTLGRIMVERHFAAPANDHEETSAEPLTEDDMSSLKQGWRTLDEAKESTVLGERIYAMALEMALTEIFLKKQERTQGLGR